MALPLHKVSQGLLSLLRLRSLGQGPVAVGDELRAIVDSTNMYGADLLVASQSTGAAGAATQGLTGVASFPGRLFAMAGVFVVGAAAGTRLTLAVSFAPGPAFPFVTLAFQDFVVPVLAAAANLEVAVVLPSPIVFQPGAQFRFTSGGDAAGADHVLVRRELFENYAP